MRPAALVRRASDRSGRSRARRRSTSRRPSGRRAGSRWRGCSPSAPRGARAAAFARCRPIRAPRRSSSPRPAPRAWPRALGAAGLRRPRRWRACCVAPRRRCATGYRGDLERSRRQCDGLEELGGRLAALAPGLGTRDGAALPAPAARAWTAARETPLARAARAAAVHIGLLAEGEDLEGEPAALRAACARHVPDLSPIDVEAALERLGAAACRRASARAGARSAQACPAR